MPSLSRGFTFFFGLRRAAAFGIAIYSGLLEWWLFVKVAPAPAAASRRRGGRPRIVVGIAAALAAAGGAGAEPAATAGAARHLLHLRRGVAQGRADLVDLQLVDGAPLAFLRLVRPLAQPSRHDHARAALQRLGDVFRRLPPHRTRQEQRLAVFPLA